MSKTVICYGDSNTFGYDPASFMGGRYPKDHRWVNILESKTNLKFLNEGMCGREIPQLQYEISLLCTRLTEWLSEKESCDLWIMLGTNDLLMHPGITAAQVAARMETLLQVMIDQPLFQSKVYSLRLLSPPHMRPGTWITDNRILAESQKMDACYAALAHRLEIPVTLTGAWNISLSFDGVHFTAEGHVQFAQHLYEEIF